MLPRKEEPVKRSLLFVLVLAWLVPACRTAGPQVAPGVASATDPLRGYLDQLRLLRQKGDKRRVQIDAGEKIAGSCTVAVRVRAAAFDRGTARFSLETVGLPKLSGREASCRRVQPELELVIAHFPAGSGAAEVSARVDTVLQTPEAFLAANGVRFDRPPGEDPTEVASNETFATNTEASLGRHVTAWPLPLLTVDPWFHARGGKLRQQSEVELDAVVGTDGRLHRPHLRTALSDVHESSVVRALRFWRFEPARRSDAPVAARIALRPVLHIY
jgi:hypothetical protein